MKWLFLLLACFSPLFANEEPIDPQASKEVILDRSENHFQIHTPYKLSPTVNPVTGDLLQQEADLVIAGCEPLSVRRFYNHLGSYEPRSGGWRYNPETFLAANFEWSKQERFAAVGDEGGAIFSFKQSAAPYIFGFDPPQSFTHFDLSGQTHPLNTTIAYWKTGDPKNKYRFCWQGEITDGTGRIRYFSSFMHTWFKDVVFTKGRKALFQPGSKYVFRATPNVWTPYLIPIHEEKKPNGNILCYTYIHWKEIPHYPRPLLLNSITAYNADKTKVLGELHFQYGRDKHHDVVGIRCAGSDGREVNFHLSGNEPIVLSKACTPDQPTISYGYQGQKIDRIEKPDGRLITTEYNDEGKVAAQYAPVGPNGQMCPIGRYKYHSYMTEVLDAEGERIDYHFDPQQRLCALVALDQLQVYRVDRMTWDAKGNLIRKAIENRANIPQQITEYKYDSRQNLIEEKVGDGKQWRTLQRTFSEDGFNLKLSETDSDKTTFYTYVPQTNLLASEFVCEADKIRKRAFYQYDTCAVCIKAIIDDGSSKDPDDLKGVTYRKITEVSPKQTLPCLGLPEIVQEKTLDATGKEILLSKVIYTYTPYGKVLTEEHYDSEGKHQYTLYNEYDARERLIFKTDPLGHLTQFKYDENNNLIAISGPKPDQYKEITYDKADRPTHIREKEHDGTFLTIEKKYDKLGRIIAEIDPCGNTTHL